MSRAIGSALAMTAISVLAALYTAPLSQAVNTEFDRYDLESVSAELSTTQAGAHPDVTTAFTVATDEDGQVFGKTRDVTIALPPGLVGNPQGLPRCTATQFGAAPPASECPQDSQVGIVDVTLNSGPGSTGVISGEPLYNMVPPAGVVARLAFFAEFYPVLIDVRVNPFDYGLEARVRGASSAIDLVGASATLWGVPAAPVHDPQRLTPEEAAHNEGPIGGRPSNLPEAPFMTNPTACGGPLPVTTTVASSSVPDLHPTMTAQLPAITGCEKLRFEPTLTVLATNPEAAAPTGLEAVLRVPQDETPKGVATSQLRSAEALLPPGLTINPAAGSGLGSCSADQVGFERDEAAHCPAAAKIGSAEIDVPALERVLKGDLYQRTPEAGNLFRLWLVSDELGVHLKLPAEIEPDPATGQLRTQFNGLAALGGNPQVPVSELKLSIAGGPRAPLSTPSSCGEYQTRYTLAPWSGGPAVSRTTPMRITTGCGKGGFAPRISAGTLSSSAGAYSPFTFELTREDGEANPALLEVALPKGLLGKLAGIPLCPEAQVSTGGCPAASQVGAVLASAGVGGDPLWVPQPGKSPTAVYLAGPYKGAPYSFLAVVPAQAGPFDLGTVVTRAGIYVNPRTAQITVKADPLPQILAGVPISYRSLRVDVSRADFTFNPTDCTAQQVGSTVVAANGAVATPSSPFQATNCAALGFKPRLALRLKGGTRRGGHPALHGVYRPRRGDSNLKRLVLRLPHSAFLDQAHIRTICTRVQYAANGGNGAGCPKASVYGHAKAWTPLLDEPLSGPVYLRSSNHNLPDFVASLHGLVDVEAVARIDSVKGGIRATFTGVPDAPLSRVAVNMQGARKGLIVNSTDLCRKKHRAAAAYTAHNARRATGRPLLHAASCSKAQRKKHRRHRANDRRHP